jgi:ferritin
LTIIFLCLIRKADGKGEKMKRSAILENLVQELNEVQKQIALFSKDTDTENDKKTIAFIIEHEKRIRQNIKNFSEIVPQEKQEESAHIIDIEPSVNQGEKQPKYNKYVGGVFGISD